VSDLGGKDDESAARIEADHAAEQFEREGLRTTIVSTREHGCEVDFHGADTGVEPESRFASHQSVIRIDKAAGRC
jgi:hypothetical protein